ncbi:hypothetical protein C5167_032846 [Papaver somniferum]|uniref:Uncharacterized protein n=1 Tax=Papaver somniferum TaxID=3469 RepID=A0A4Y7KC28_PAPSO|nr:hypothetical protein C5167_032846 [Papaver somniferum]
MEDVAKVKQFILVNVRYPGGSRSYQNQKTRNNEELRQVNAATKGDVATPLDRPIFSNRRRPWPIDQSDRFKCATRTFK